MTRFNSQLLLAILITLAPTFISCVDEAKMKQHDITDWFPNWWFPEMKPPTTLDDPAWDCTVCGWQTAGYQGKFHNDRHGWVGLLVENDRLYNPDECGKKWREGIKYQCGEIREWTCTYVGQHKTTAAMTFILKSLIPVPEYGCDYKRPNAKRDTVQYGNECYAPAISEAVYLKSDQRIPGVDTRDRSRFCNEFGCEFWRCQAAGVCPP